MALFGSTAFARENHIPASAAETFAALLIFLRSAERSSGWTVTQVDEFLLSATFKTGITAMTYGMSGSVQVIPTGDQSSTLNITVTPKMGGQYRNGANQQRIADEVLAGVSHALQFARTSEPTE